MDHPLKRCLIWICQISVLIFKALAFRVQEKNHQPPPGLGQRPLGLADPRSLSCCLHPLPALVSLAILTCISTALAWEGGSLRRREGLFGGSSWEQG